MPWVLVTTWTAPSWQLAMSTRTAAAGRPDGQGARDDVDGTQVAMSTRTTAAGRPDALGARDNVDSTQLAAGHEYQGSSCRSS